MDEMTMQVSGVCTREGRKCAYVTFTDEKRRAEGVIPDCRILTQNGFTDEEIGQLELFMKMKLGELKKQAAGINPIKAMMKEDK